MELSETKLSDGQESLSINSIAILFGCEVSIGLYYQELLFIY